MSGKNSLFSGGEWWCVIRCSFFNCYNVHAVLWYFLFVLCHVNVAPHLPHFAMVGSIFPHFPPFFRGWSHFLPLVAKEPPNFHPHNGNLFVRNLLPTSS